MFGCSLILAFGLFFGLFTVPLLSYAQDRTVDPALSLGIQHPVSKDGRQIDGFQTLGVHSILSDRIILTPIYPGAQRAAIWSEGVNPYHEWTAEIEFRATGEERSGGAFHFWYTAGGAAVHGTDSVYTAKPFDGLVVLVDKYGNYGGSLRAFLNDGKTDYSIHHNVHSLSFAHCDFSYRNLGAPSKITIEHTSQGFKVLTNDRVCFQTKEVHLPLNYHFGISAASADQPDSFELFQMKISSYGRQNLQSQQANDNAKPHQYDASYKHGAGSQPIDHPDQYQGKLPHEANFERLKHMTDEDASRYKTTDEKFKDLHDRIQSLTHHLARLEVQLGETYDKVESINQRLDEYKTEARITRVSKEQIDRVEQKLITIENLLRGLEKPKDYTSHFDSIHHALRDQHSNLLYAVPDSVARAIHTTTGSKLRLLIGLLIVVQIGSGIGYVLYKRRRSQSPKKFL